jgi:hypothetical protein
VAPFIEESLKACYIVYLVRAKRVGFPVDAAIYGFAVGAGFALIENAYFLHSVGDASPFIWIARGFGTAVMHGGTTAIFAVLSKTMSDRYMTERAYIFLPGLTLAIAFHGGFNQFILPPFETMVVQLVLFPVAVGIIFARSERSLRDWLELGLYTDVLILDLIKTGDVSGTKIGRYLDSLRSRFPGETVVDILCLLRIYLELAIRAKGALLMRGAGYSVVLDAETEERFEELEHLKKSIGKTGMLAVSPLLHTTSRDLWQLYVLGGR